MVILSSEKRDSRLQRTSRHSRQGEERFQSLISTLDELNVVQSLVERRIVALYHFSRCSLLQETLIAEVRRNHAQVVAHIL